jgi:hypothetical protein
VSKESLDGGREKFFDDFYRYYKSLNIIGNETPSRSVIRGLLYEELFKVNENSKTGEIWTTEMVKYGYSSKFKCALMRLFILSTSLSYRMVEINNGLMRLNVDKVRTIMNSKVNFEKIRKGNCQFYIKDKRITEMIVNSFPTLGYTYGDIHKEASILCDDISLLNFEQMRLGSYYLKIHQSTTRKKEGVNYGKVSFNELDIKWEDLVDHLGIESSLKGFETACSLVTSPEKLSSPTMSAVYPSAKGLLEVLVGNGFIESQDNIIELCGGRGDFHLAMMELNIKHTTLSREDGYNLAMRIPGMTSKKTKFNCFRPSDYLPYFDHSIILLDMSHITEKEDCLSNIIGDAKIGKKKIILRLNGLNKFLNNEIIKEMVGYELKVFIPELDSPGYVFLSINFSKGKEHVMIDKWTKSSFGYTRSLLSSALINAVSKVSLNKVISIPPKLVQDQTQEVISDGVLSEMLLETEPDYIHINEDMRDRIKCKDDLVDNILVYASEKIINRYKGKVKLVQERLVTRGPSEENDHLPRNLVELSRRIRTKNELTIEVDSKILRNTSLGIVKGVTNMSTDELVEFIEDIVSIKTNKRMSIECWKLILQMSGNEISVDSELLVESINVRKFNKAMHRTINSSFEIASKAVLSFKTGRIIEGLLCVANMDNMKRKSILNHKDKTTRNNILHYKLYINRIMLISSSFYKEPNFIGVTKEEFERYWNNIGSQEEEIDMKRISDSLQSDETLSILFEELNKEYFSFMGHFSSAIEKMEERIGVDLSTPMSQNLTIENFGLNITEGDTEMNKELDTVEKLESYLGEEEMFELWGQEIGDWASEED